MGRLAVALVLLLAGAAPASAQELTLSVAISMKDVVEELGRRFAVSRGAPVLRYNFGSSGELEKQIEAGAPVDVFVSAGARQMAQLEAKGLVVAATRRDFARNVLVAIEPADSAVALHRPADLLDPRVERIVIGNPRTVPAGQYAEESLRSLGLWERLRPRLVLAENVRQALEWVARGEVDVGFVYATDAALRRGRAREAFRVPPETHSPIVYPAAVVAATRQAPLARVFVEFLTGRDAGAVLARFGFEPVSEPGRAALRPPSPAAGSSSGK